jgi:hypothetical protein
MIETLKRMIELFVAARRGVSLQTVNILQNFIQINNIVLYLPP